MAAIVEKWKLLQGMGRPEAMAAYVALVREWPGFGSTLFDVDLRAVRPRRGGGGGQRWRRAALTALSPQSALGAGPQRLWLGVGAKAVSLYKPGEPEPLDSFCYGRISSFGASDSSTFRLSVEDRELLFETPQVWGGCRPPLLPVGAVGGRAPRADPACPRRWTRSPSSSTRTSPRRVPSSHSSPWSRSPAPQPRTPPHCPRGSAPPPDPGSTVRRWAPSPASPAATAATQLLPPDGAGRTAGRCWSPAAPRSRGPGARAPHANVAFLVISLIYFETPTSPTTPSTFPGGQPCRGPPGAAPRHIPVPCTPVPSPPALVLPGSSVRALLLLPRGLCLGQGVPGSGAAPSSVCPSAEPTSCGKLRAAFGRAAAGPSGLLVGACGQALLPAVAPWRGRGGRWGSGWYGRGSAPQCCLCKVCQFCPWGGGGGGVGVVCFSK